MKKNGFTLVELLIVIVLIAVITTIGTAGVIAVKRNIEKNLWESTISLIEKAAIEYGEDRKNAFESNAGTCKIDGVDKNPCMKVSVKTLLEKNYISTKETIGTGDDEQKVLINNTKEKDEEGYYLGTDSFASYALIYLENDVIYAKYVDGEVSISDEGTILGKENIKVSFRAINDTFLNNQNIVEVNIHISSDGKYYLTDRDIPAVKTDKNGSWDQEPVNNKIVNDGMTFTYTYEEQLCSSGMLLANCITSQYFAQGDNGLYYHNNTLANGANDNSYRYAGSYESVHNWVCFGINNKNCDDDHLYRIIGVFDNKVKLIKAYEAGESTLGYSPTGNRTSIGSYYKGKLTAIPEYMLSENGDGSTNIWEESSLNTVILNNRYLEKLGTTWSNKIADYDWKVAGVSIYNMIPSSVFQDEIINLQPGEYGKNKTTHNAKIGLMYISDFGFAASPENWTKVMGYTGDDGIRNNNWLFLGVFEFTITRENLFPEATFIINTVGGLQGIGYSTNVAVRPSFYLKTSVTFAGGTGTETDPIRIN